MLASLAIASLAVLVWQTIRPAPMVFAGLALDRLSAVTGLFVAGVGWAVHRFAARAMEGHRDRSRFLATLAGTACMAFLFACASNLLLMAVAWLLLGAGAHLLLLFGSGTRVGWLALRRKFVAARLGEASLLTALALLWWRSGELEVGDCLAAARDMSDMSVTPIAILFAVAAMTRSVQVPFHAWLPDTMDAPTPVSALLHAGIVNAGGILLIRFAPIVVRVPEAWLSMSIIGTATIVVGTLAMAQQGRMKQSLAWSTVAQMGFMVVQCALAAFPAALLHLVGHGAWKALAFLRSGEAPVPARSTGPAWLNVSLLLAGTASAIPAMRLAERWTGFSPWHAPGEMALAAVVAIATGQAWIACLAGSGLRPASRLGGAARSIACTLVMPTACFALYRVSDWFLHPVLGDVALPTGPLATVAAAVPTAAIALLACAHSAQPWLDRRPAWRSLSVQARSGFHLGRLTDRAVDIVLPPNRPSETRHA